MPTPAPRHETSRTQAKAATRQRILDVARAHLATEGAAQLSMRRIAHDVGVVPSALYKHVPTRDALLTELIKDAYRGLADHLDAAPATWARRALALREWAVGHPHEFQLIYGTPVIGYAAPADTIQPAARVLDGFLAVIDDPPDAELPEALARQLCPLAETTHQPVGRIAAVLARLSQLVGMIMLELGGHFVGTLTPADHFYGWVVSDTVSQLSSGSDPSAASPGT